MNTATQQKMSDTEPFVWPNALENALGYWEALLSDPEALNARAADLRGGHDHDNPRTRESGMPGITLEDLIGRLCEFVDDPERLDARAAALRAFEATTTAAEIASWGQTDAARSLRRHLKTPFST